MGAPLGNSKLEEAQKVWEAIKDIDRISKSNDEDKLDMIWHCISEIPKANFDTSNVEDIIAGIRDSLVKIYKEKINSASEEINVHKDFIS